MSAETNWQTTRPTIRERAKFLFNNDRLSDVKFVVRKSESLSKHVIPAHKFVLSIGSPVFEVMFNSDLAETRDSIELPDCEYESLLELFRYMYSDEVNLSGNNVMGVLYLANKYIVPSLADKCTDYVQDKLDPSNVLYILAVAQKCEEKSLVNRCWEVIDNQTEATVKSDEFETIEKSLLEALVSRDALTIKAVELFKAVDLWATKQCQKQGLAADGQMKRRILGEEIIKAIRFQEMEEWEFSGVVRKAKILTYDETFILYKFFNKKLKSASTQSSTISSTRFSRTRTRPVDVHVCARFTSMTSSFWGQKGVDKDFIGLAVDKDITLCGVCLFGTKKNSYTVKVEVKDVSDNLTLVSTSETYPSKLLQRKKYSYYGFVVSFNPVVFLKNTNTYEIEAIISGPTSYLGCTSKGLGTVEVSGVRFSFSNVSHINSSTTSHGQFPEFLFSV